MLNCEGALPKLLQLLSRASDVGKLASSLLTASAQVTLTQVPSLDEIKAVIDLVRTSMSTACHYLYAITHMPSFLCAKMPNA